MCFELCGPPLNGDPVEDAAYEAWLDSLDSEEEEETSNKIDEREAMQRFDDLLNEIHEVVTVCGYDYDAATAFKRVDPTAYRYEFINWLDSEGLELE